MTRDELASVLRSILGGIAPEVDLARARTDRDLRDELDIDSMDFLRFVVGIHERLAVEVPESDYPRIRTLDSCLAYLERRLDRTHGAPVP
jgi:acyl carrier protein